MRVRTRIITTVGAGAVISVLGAGSALASTHTVQAGDTLSGIASQSGVSLAQVEAANPQITNPDVITVGDLVNLPGAGSGTGSSTPASSAPASSTQPSSTQATTPATSQSSGGSAPSSFQQCVAWRESSNNPTASSAGLYGILPSTWASLGYSGTAGQAPVSVQNQAFQQLYDKYGTSPWAPYDGC